MRAGAPPRPPAAAVVAAYVVALLLAWAAEWAWPALRPPAPLAYVVSPICLLGCGLVAWRRTGAALPARWPGAAWAVAAVAAGAALKFAGDALVVLERPWLGPLQGNNPVVAYPHAFTHPAGVAVLVGAVALLTPAAEEVFFRGLLYGWLRSRLGVAAGTAVAAVLFAVAHGSPGLILPLGLVGAGLCVLYERSGSLWPPVLAHAAVNALALAFALLAAPTPGPG